MTYTNEQKSSNPNGFENAPHNLKSEQFALEKEVKESISNKDVRETQPKCSDSPHATIEVHSRENTVQPTATRSRHRTTETVNVEKKNFNPREIFEEDEFEKVVESMGKVAAYAFLEGWEIETRKRKTGALDHFYSHEKSSKVLRSLPETKRFIKRITNPQRMDYDKSSEHASTKRKEGIVPSNGLEPRAKTSPEEISEATIIQLRSSYELEEKKQPSPRRAEVEEQPSPAPMSKEEELMPTPLENLEGTRNNEWMNSMVKEFDLEQEQTITPLEILEGAGNHELIDSMVNELLDPDFVLHIRKDG